jgi:hypothetical protein
VEFVPTFVYNNDGEPDNYKYSYKIQNNIYCQENKCLNNGACFISLNNTSVCSCTEDFIGIFKNTIKKYFNSYNKINFKVNIVKLKSLQLQLLQNVRNVTTFDHLDTFPLPLSVPVIQIHVKIMACVY